MTAQELRRELATRNLTHLSEASGISVRTLRRIKNGQTAAVLSTTIDALRRHLRGRRK